MVSEVEGELRDGVGDAACCGRRSRPARSPARRSSRRSTSSPSSSHRREAYTGAIGFASPLAGLELSVAIRTFEVRGPRIWLGAGRRHRRRLRRRRRGARGGREGGPAACGDRRRRGGHGRSADGDCPPRPPRSRGRAAARAAADPGAGAVRDRARAGRRPREGSTRTSRGSPGSLRALYGSRCRPTWPPGSRTRRADTRGRGCASTSCRARRPRSRSPSSQQPAPAVGCGRSSSPGGLGPHKWRDRTLLEATRPTTRPRCRCCSTPTGYVLEPAAPSVVAGPRTARCTRRPADGRILPGRHRRRPARDAAGAHARRPRAAAERPRHERAARPRRRARVASVHSSYAAG
jgi:para-aminobenzoate synthetase/4-amino-4-deoxychorismate lyase